MSVADPHRSNAASRAVAAAYDAHGSALLALATVLLDDADAAQAVTVETLACASSGPRGGPPDRPELVRRLYLRCRADTGARGRGSTGRRDMAFSRPPYAVDLQALSDGERAALGLCVYGRRDYRWVAEVMGVAPKTAAQLLCSALHHLTSTG